ncbi:hypothetical protein EON64_12105, partial [archaeon]
MYQKNDYTPSVGDYLCLIRSLLQGGDLISGVEAIQDLESCLPPSSDISPSLYKALVSLREVLAG